VLASVTGALSVVGGFVMLDARVVALGGALLILGGATAFLSGRTLTPTGWARPEELAAIRDPADRAAAEKAIAWIVGSLLLVVGSLILALSLSRALSLLS
jgi:hypothetical protein